MANPNWTAATPGQATLAGQINQFLVPHSSTFIYTGSAVNVNVPIGTTQDSLVTNNALAYRFFSSSSQTISRVVLGLVITNSGSDVLLTLQGDSGAGPNGTVLASCYIPAEWLSTSNAAIYPNTGFPLSYTLSGSTYYNIVLQTVNQNSTSSNATSWIRANSVVLTGAYTQNASGTWTPQTYGYTVGLYGGTSGALQLVSDDSQSKMTGYTYNGSSQITMIKEWVAKTGPVNLLSRDDAGFTASIGSWTGTNATLALSNGTTDPTYDGTYSLKMTAGTTPSSISASTAALAPTTNSLVTYVPVTSSTIYSASAQVAPNGTTMRNAKLSINWYTSTGTLISSSAGPIVAETAQKTFVFVTASGIAPSNAAIASLTVTITPTTGNLTTGEVHFVDVVGLFAGSNTIWSYPGLGLSSSKNLSYSGTNLTSMA